jgi:nucleotide-binding universal stress UspA family protein
MIRSILVPLDGSAIAERGLWSARTLARETGAALWLLRAVPLGGSSKDAGASERRLIQQARDYLAAQQEALAGEGFTVQIEVLPGEPAPAILFAREAHDIDLISICTHGYTGIRHVLLGSVAEAVLQRAPVPVLITRAGMPAGDDGAGGLTKILVPIDGTPFAEAALAYVRREQIGPHAKVIVFRAVPPVLPPAIATVSDDTAAKIVAEADKETSRLHAEAYSYVNATGNRYLAGTAWTSRVAVGVPEEEIASAASAQQADLIVMATHGRRGVDRLIHGSVAGEVVRRAQVPVLLLHGADEHATY